MNEEHDMTQLEKHSLAVGFFNEGVLHVVVLESRPEVCPDLL
jgi:hypothetical protein